MMFYQYCQHCSVSQHRVDIVLISYKHLQRILISALHHRHRLHRMRSVDQLRVDIVLNKSSFELLIDFCFFI